MGGQRVHSRPLFTNRKIKHIKDGITTTSRGQLSAKNRLEIFEHTGVTAHEYDITLPCGIRRETLPIRHNINPAGDAALRQREEQIVVLRRKKALTELTRERARADCKQLSATRKQKLRGGGVRESMEKNKLIAHNKEKWLAMCIGKARQGKARQGKASDDKTGDRQGKNDKEEGEETGSCTLVGQRKHSSDKHKPPLTDKHHGGAMAGDREGGGEGGKGPPSRARDRTSKDGKNRIAKGRGSSAKELKMEDYYTRTPRKKQKGNESSL